MKTVGVREAKEHLSGWIRASQRECVMVVSHGQPAAVIIGIEGIDPEDAVLAELHRRRLSRTAITGEEMSRRLRLDPAEEASWRRWAVRHGKALR